MSSSLVLQTLLNMFDSILQVGTDIIGFLSSYVFDIGVISEQLGIDLTWIPQELLPFTWGSVLFGIAIFTIIQWTIMQWIIRFIP